MNTLADGEGSRVTVLHHGYQSGENWDWSYDIVVRGWKASLERLQT